MENRFRCDCPVTSALDVIGDKWTLVIIKQMLLEGAKTFKDFTESEEAIATNILSARLKMLEEFHILRKEKLPHNKKTNIHILTEKGLGLAPIIIEMVLWSDGHLREFNPEILPPLQAMLEDKTSAVRMLVGAYKKENWQ